MDTSRQLIEFDAERLDTPEERRGFLSTLARAAGAVALAPMILRGGQLEAALRGPGPTCNGPALEGWAEREALSDFQILNFALVLEYLESTFYLRGNRGGPLPMGATIADIDPEGRGRPGQVPGLDRVTPPATSLDTPAMVDLRPLIRTVRDHEIGHVLFLQNALGDLALSRENFEFDFGDAFSSAENFLGVAQVLEDVGVTAYLGQVGNIDDAGILAAAGSIAGVEAEHAATFRLANGASVTPENQAFDTRRDLEQVVAAASPFIAAPDVDSGDVSQLPG